MNANSLLKFVVITLLTIGLMGLFAALPTPKVAISPQSSELQVSSWLKSLSPEAAIAQRYEIEGLWRQVYENLPDLPLENQYISRSSGEVAEDNTLVGRLIRYHVYVRGRPPIYRFDWKLTLADYLGINEQIVPSLYPSADALRVNPLEGDIAAIEALNRSQRDALVQVLVDTFSSAFNRTQSPAQPPIQPPEDSAPSPVPPSSPSRLRDPQPGDADLLLP
jgi:hypothetical protein